MIKAVIFDLDGILLDTESYQWKGWIIPLKEMGIELSKDDYIREYAGDSGPNIEKRLIERFKLGIESGELLEKKEALLMEWFAKNIKKMHYVDEIIQFFKNKGLRLAVCSGGGREEVELKLRVNGLFDNFEKITSLSDVEHGKPAPDIYLRCAETLGLKPEECIAFEDTSSGVKAASGAGMDVYAIPTEWSQGQDFSLAKGVYRNLQEVLEVVKSKYGF